MFLTVGQQTVSCFKKCRKNRSLQKFPFQVSLPILSMFSGSSVRLRSGRVEISDGRIGNLCLRDTRTNVLRVSTNYNTMNSKTCITYLVRCPKRIFMVSWFGGGRSFTRDFIASIFALWSCFSETKLKRNIRKDRDSTGMKGFLMRFF